MAIKILFLTPYPKDQAPSQRFRFEQYYEILTQAGFKYDIKPFLSQNAWQIFYSKNLLSISFFLISGFIKRVLHIFHSISYQYVFIHREITPLGPPVFEWFIGKVLRKKIIYDFDDAIWLDDPEEKGTLKAKLKWKSKVAKICKWSYKVSVGNEYLAEFARKYNTNIVVNPTTIDTVKMHNPYLVLRDKPEYSDSSQSIAVGQVNLLGYNHNPFDSAQGTPVIGWTGTHSTLQYLDQIIPVIVQLEKKYEFTFLVIANKNPQLKLKSFQFIPWQKETEIEDLMRIDIGIMPLTDDEWSRGKCGFKLLQFMALEKPVLASPVGVNVILQNANGFICHSERDWFEKMELLINQPKKRKEFGERGRTWVTESYSITSNQANFLSLFE